MFLTKQVRSLYLHSETKEVLLLRFKILDLRSCFKNKKGEIHLQLQGKVLKFSFPVQNIYKRRRRVIN